MNDMMKMLGQVREMQAKIQEAQESLGSITAEGEAGGGMVKAVANGKKQVLELYVDEDIINKDDKEMMQDLIIAAVNKALHEVEDKSREYLQQSTEGLMPNIPGFNPDDLKL
ncbi:MAG: YbaB/EbfC family nucleoid-associated protein [Bernardetiaceae bacterium]|nr:YbaB/EbfC family nucleoid-associated protein [Bernardetiaceae bacterium]